MWKYKKSKKKKFTGSTEVVSTKALEGHFQVKFQVKIHLNFQVKFQVNMEAQVGQLHVKFHLKFHSKFQVKFHLKFRMKLALQSFRRFQHIKSFRLDRLECTVTSKEVVFGSLLIKKMPPNWNQLVASPPNLDTNLKYFFQLMSVVTTCFIPFLWLWHRQIWSVILRRKNNVFERTPFGDDKPRFAWISV